MVTLAHLLPTMLISRFRTYRRVHRPRRTAVTRLPLRLFRKPGRAGAADARAPGGAELFLGLGEDYSVVFAEAEDGWLLVHLRAGAGAASAENGGAALSLAELERFALGLFPAG